jgi:hypothetical protein
MGDERFEYVKKFLMEHGYDEFHYIKAGYYRVSHPYDGSFIIDDVGECLMFYDNTKSMDIPYET